MTDRPDSPSMAVPAAGDRTTPAIAGGGQAFAALGHRLGIVALTGGQTLTHELWLRDELGERHCLVRMTVATDPALLSDL